MSKVPQPHDSFFRDSFSHSELAIALCRNYLPPDIAAALDPNPAAWELCSGNYVDDALGGHVTDLLYLTRLKSGDEVYIYILLEHKSRPDRFVSLQMLRYKVHTWEQDHREYPRRPLRPILPLVIYHGRERWRVPTNFASLLADPGPWRAYCPDFQYLLVDLSRHTSPPTAGDPRLLARLLALRAAFSMDLEGALSAILDRLDQLSDTGLLVRELRIILVYLSATPVGAQSPGVAEATDRLLLTRGTLMVNSWLKHEDDLRAEGLQKGLRQGVLRALDSRLGAGGMHLQPYINSLHSTEQLETALDAIVKAENAESLARTLAALATG